MSRARGRGRHSPPTRHGPPGQQGDAEQYLYGATGESQRKAHEEQLRAQQEAGEGQEPAGPHPIPARDLGAAWDRLTPRNPRTPPGRSAAEIAALGQGDWRGIPGGKNHNDANPVPPHEIPPDKEGLEYFRGMMAHGVPPQEVGVYHREMQDHARHPYEPEYAQLPLSITPVPVYVVAAGGGPKPRAESTLRHITVPAAGSEPVPVCGADLTRSIVQLLNEDTTHNCRFGPLAVLQWDAANSKVTGGARLPANATGYTVIRTQRPLYVVSEDSGTPSISIILEYEVAEAG